MKLVAAVIGAMMIGAMPASAAVLQINTPFTPPDWNQNSATQTGTVGTAGVSITTNNLPWNTTFINDDALYSSSLFGALAQPAGTVGDFATISASEGDIFTIEVSLGDALIDPIFYLVDIDTISATVAVPAGATTKVASADGSFAGDTLTHLVGGGDGTFGAVQYAGLFPASSIFAFDFNFDTNNFSRELIALGIAGDNVRPDSMPVPEPGTLTLFGLSLVFVCMLRTRRRKAV